MNRNQKIAVATGATVVLLMLLFPPFQIQTSYATFNMGYGFILDPPKLDNLTPAASVNAGMLLVQWVGTLVLTALAFFLLKSSGDTYRDSSNSRQ